MVLETRMLELTKENAMLRAELVAMRDKFGGGMAGHQDQLHLHIPPAQEQAPVHSGGDGQLASDRPPQDDAPPPYHGPPAVAGGARERHQGAASAAPVAHAQPAAAPAGHPAAGGQREPPPEQPHRDGTAPPTPPVPSQGVVSPSPRRGLFVVFRGRTSPGPDPALPPAEAATQDPDRGQGTALLLRPSALVLPRQRSQQRPRGHVLGRGQQSGPRDGLFAGGPQPPSPQDGPTVPTIERRDELRPGGRELSPEVRAEEARIRGGWSEGHAALQQPPTAPRHAPAQQPHIAQHRREPPAGAKQLNSH